MTANDIAWLAGLAATMITAAIWFIVLVTRDYSPVERRARRLAILASVLVSAAIWSVTVTIYSLFSQVVGNFVMFPSIGLTALAIWHASRITYRQMGGGQKSADSPRQGPGRDRDLVSGPAGNNLVRLAEALRVDPAEVMKVDSKSTAPRHEMQLLSAFRALPDERQLEAIKLVETLKSSGS